MQKLLSFKHWQLFLLIFICGARTSPSPLKEIVNSVAAITFAFWIYAVGIYGQERVGESGLKQMNIKLFKINVTLMGTVVFLGLVWSAITGGEQKPTPTSDAFGFLDVVSALVSQ